MKSFFKPDNLNINCQNFDIKSVKKDYCHNQYNAGHWLKLGSTIHVRYCTELRLKNIFILKVEHNFQLERILIEFDW